MPAFDTDALVALVDQDNEHHAEARRRFVQADLVLLLPSVLSEFTTVVRRHARAKRMDGNKAARKALSQLLAEPRVRVEAQLDYLAASKRYLETPGLSYTDALVAQMRWHHDQLDPVTFDKAVLRAARKSAR